MVHPVLKSEPSYINCLKKGNVAMRAFGKVTLMTVICLTVMSRCLAGSRFGGGRQEGRSTFGRVVEGVGGTAFTVAGAGLASSGVAAVGGAIANASTSLAMGGTATGFLGAVGMGAGIVALGASVALFGIHCITDATGIWTFEDSRNLFDKGCQKLADWLTGKKRDMFDQENTGLVPASMLDPLPELDSMQEFINRTGNGSARTAKVMDAGTLKRIDPEAYEALSGDSGTSASESSSERVKKMREKRKELRERLAAMDVDDGSQDWCRCDEPGCVVGSTAVLPETCGPNGHKWVMHGEQPISFDGIVLGTLHQGKKRDGFSVALKRPYFIFDDVWVSVEDGRIRSIVLERGFQGRNPLIQKTEESMAIGELICKDIEKQCGAKLNSDGRRCHRTYEWHGSGFRSIVLIISNENDNSPGNASFWLTVDGGYGYSVDK